MKGIMFQFNELPEDHPIRAMFTSMQEQHDHAHQHNQVFIHRLHDWMDTITGEENLRTLRDVLLAAGATEHDVGQMFLGIIAQRLKVEHNICIACNRNHDEELEKMQAQAELVNNDWTSFINNLDPSVIEVMNELGVEFIPQQYPKIKCKNCGKEYVSLEDRMRRKPGADGCDGCQQKSAWG
jgi:hypothetical protein